MEADKIEKEILERAIKQWQQEGKLSIDQATELTNSITIKKTERQQIAQYFFIIALSCTLLAFGAIFIDEKFLEKLKAYFSLSNIMIAGITAAISIFWFWYISKRRAKLNPTTFEVYMILGGLSALTSLVYVLKDFGNNNGYSAFLFVAFLLLCALSIVFRSRSLWVGAILALMGWFGVFSTAHSYHNLFLGMNYPVRFSVFGLVLLGVAFLQANSKWLAFSRSITFLFGMLIFFTGMWGVSIFGNFNYLDEWEKVRQTRVIVYAVIFALVSGLSLFLGIKYKNELARDFGFLFLLVNLYTRYFEYFWDAMNKGIFFLILGVTFWLVGRWIEKNKKLRLIKK